MKPMRIFPLSVSVRRKNDYIKDMPGLTRYCRSYTGFPWLGQTCFRSAFAIKAEHLRKARR